MAAHAVPSGIALLANPLLGLSVTANSVKSDCQALLRCSPLFSMTLLKYFKVSFQKLSIAQTKAVVG